MAEILKMALVRDVELFELLESHGRALVESHFALPGPAAEAVVDRAIRLMLEELASNPYEDRSYERLVDFGHTFSGAIEEASAHAVRHGDAVALDMALSCVVALELGLLDERDWGRIRGVYDELGLPLCSPHCTPGVLVAGMDAATAHRGGRLNLVLPAAVGRAVFVRDASAVTRATLERAIERLAEERRAPHPLPPLVPSWASSDSTPARSV